MTHSPRPTAAEIARSLVLASSSLSARWDGGGADLLDAHACTELGDLVLATDAGSALARWAAAAPAGDSRLEPKVSLHFTRLAAVSVSERVLAQLTVTARLSPAPTPTRASAALSCRHAPSTSAYLDPPAGHVLLHASVTSAVLERHSEVIADPGVNLSAIEVVPGHVYRAAEPDPLALEESDQLHHLSADHADVIDLLCRLVDSRHILHAVAVMPLALDRYGIVLRIERARGHVDVRLPFRRTVDSASEAGHEIRSLLVRATQRRCWPSATTGGAAS